MFNIWHLKRPKRQVSRGLTYFAPWSHGRAEPSLDPLPYYIQMYLKLFKTVKLVLLNLD